MYQAWPQVRPWAQRWQKRLWCPRLVWWKPAATAPTAPTAVQTEPTWVFPKIGVPQNGWFIMENHPRSNDIFKYMNDSSILTLPKTNIAHENNYLLFVSGRLIFSNILKCWIPNNSTSPKTNMDTIPNSHTWKEIHFKNYHFWYHVSILDFRGGVDRPKSWVYHSVNQHVRWRFRICRNIRTFLSRLFSWQFHKKHKGFIHEPWKNTALLVIQSWLFYRDPYFMVSEKESPHNWVVFHPLYTVNNRSVPCFSLRKHAFRAADWTVCLLQDLVVARLKTNHHTTSSVSQKVQVNKHINTWQFCERDLFGMII